MAYRRFRAPVARPAATATLAALAGLVALFGMPLPAAAQDAVTLRLGAHQGETATYRFEQDLNFQMPPEFGGDQQVRSRLVLAQAVQRVVGDTIHYRTEVEDIAVEMAGSQATGDLDFSQFQGQHFVSTVTRRGEVLNLEMPGAAEAGEQIEHSLRQVGFPILPQRAVRVGESWVDTVRVDASAMALPAEGEIVSINRTTLRGLSRSGESTIAELDVETTFSFEPGARAMPGMQVEMSGTRADDVRFDVTRGRFLGATGRQDFTLEMAMPGASGSFTIQGTAESRATLVE